MSSDYPEDDGLLWDYDARGVQQVASVPHDAPVPSLAANEARNARR